MNFIMITGPHAVGKMTVGQALAKKMDYKLFHNHMSIDLVSQFFSFGSKPFNRLNTLIREEMFHEAAKSDMEGFIFTYIWAFDEASDCEYAQFVFELFESYGHEVYLVELEADFDIRLERNKTENRLANKPTKRNVEHSEKIFKMVEGQYRLNSRKNEIKRANYLRINNTHLQAEEVADQIIAHFNMTKLI